MLMLCTLFESFSYYIRDETAVDLCVKGLEWIVPSGV